MHNVLLLTEAYLGKANANGLCAREIANELTRQGSTTYVISCSSEKDTTHCDDHVISIYKKSESKPTTYSKARRMFSTIKKRFLYSWTPKYDKQLVSEIVEAGKTLLCKYSIDTLVCFYFPLETIIAGSRLKKLYPNLKFVIYEVDSVIDGIGGTSRLGRLIAFPYERFANTIYKVADSIMILKCHEHAWHKEHSQFAHKVSITDLPLMVKKEVPSQQAKHTSTDFLYAGILSEKYRSPQLMLDILSSLEVCNDWNLHFFSKGCEKLLHEASQCDSRIILHSYVEQEILNASIAKADFLLCIGNSASNSLPSKLISYMAYGKPIIHFSLQHSDVCVEYLKKYPLALCISHDEALVDAIKKTEKFIKDTHGAQIPFDKISEIFAMNRPAYSISLILNDKEAS